MLTEFIYKAFGTNYYISVLGALASDIADDQKSIFQNIIFFKEYHYE